MKIITLFVILSILRGDEIPIEGLKFNGKDSYILVQNSKPLSLLGDFTIEFWARTEPDSQYAHILSKHQPGINDDGSWVLKYDFRSPEERSFNFGWPYMPNQINYDLTDSLSLLGWFHLALCYSEEEQRAAFFLNGELTHTESANIQTRNTEWPLYIGTEGSYNAFDGELAHLRFSNIVRYNSEFRPQSSFHPDDFTIAYWPLDEINRNTVSDLSMNSFDGKAYNFRQRTLSTEFLFVLILIISGVVFWNMRRKIKEPDLNTVQPLIQGGQEKRKSHLKLFGEFQVFDRGGEDISHLFSPNLKRLFLLALLETINGRSNGGISVQKLNETLWPGIDTAKIKNTRSVTIYNLRKILPKIGQVELINEKQHLKLLLDETVTVDYFEFINQYEKNALTDISHFCQVISDGSFLDGIDDDWLDQIKGEVTMNVIDKCESLYDIANNDTEKLLLTNVTLKWDSLNETAIQNKIHLLEKSGKHGIAKNVMDHFQTEYESVYGEKSQINF